MTIQIKLRVISRRENRAKVVETGENNDRSIKPKALTPPTLLHLNRSDVHKLKAAGESETLGTKIDGVQPIASVLWR